jgi:hypothetical protein
VTATIEALAHTGHSFAQTRSTLALSTFIITLQVCLRHPLLFDSHKQPADPITDAKAVHICDARFAG